MTRILVIDDNTPLRDAICENLQEIGHETVAVSDGRHVDQVQRLTPVDLVITDLFMPNTDGLEVIAFFRQNFPKVPIIAISSGGSRGMVELLTVARRLGAQRTLMKPFERADLLAAVEELLGSLQDSGRLITPESSV
jgi:CheY-like chemotaxis protein